MASDLGLRTVAGAGTILELIRDGRARTRTDLVEMTGLARSTVAQRVDSLVAKQLVVSRPGSTSTGGRPPELLVFNRHEGVVLGIALGATRAMIAVADLEGEVLAEHMEEVDIAAGPELVLEWAAATLSDLLIRADRPRSSLRCVGVGLPGPIERGSGRPVCPPLMPGWDGFGVRDWLQRRLGVPVLVDNDVNAMALGETRGRSAPAHLIFVKAGTGIGVGITSEGVLQRGSQGAAGDLGHTRTHGHDDVACRCGSYGCLEAVAGGGALARRFGVETVRDVSALVTRGDAEAVAAMRAAGREIGAVLAAAVNLLNPAEVVVEGDLADDAGHLLGAIREAIYRDSPALATSELRIARSRRGDRAGLAGAIAMSLDHVLAPTAIELRLAA